MITAADAEFHPNDPSLTYWTETIGFWFAVPEEQLYGNIYVLARPNVGAVISSINVVQGLNHHPFTADFTDPQVHAPCPDSMLDFELASGLSVHVDKPPTDYRFVHHGIAGTCDIDVTLTGVMPAWDPTDPDENPLLARSPEHENLGLGDAWAGGHLDFVGRVTGSLTLRGKTYPVDAMGGMDRSWGVRTELGESAISYLHIPFGDDYGIHLVTGIELQRGESVYTPLRFGYVYRDGAVRGIVEATIETNRLSLLPYATTIRVTDDAGDTIEVSGHAVAGAPWYTFSPSYVAFQSLMHYELDGRHAHGLMSDIYGIEFLADRTSRHGTKTRDASGPGI